MERPNPTADGSACWTLPRWAFLLGAAALCLWHGWLTLALFGDEPWEKILNDQPIVSGIHPQHLYIGSLGAKGLATNWMTVVYDFAFQAGWPKTPIFDGGRLAELFLLLGGGSYQPAAYKLGFAVSCFLVPWFFLVACKSVGLGHGTSLLATILGQLIWWGPHGRVALVSGDYEFFLAALAGLAHVGFLISFHRTAGVSAWFGLWLTGCVVWFLQPLLFPIALPILLTYYLSVGTKHDFLTWHFAFWGAELLGIAVNLPWLTDWFDSWWLRAALPSPAGMLEHRTFYTVWNAPLWGGPASRLLAVFLIVSACVGVGILNQTHERPAARLLGFTALGALVLALLGISWEPLGVLGTAALFAPALWFACLPAAHGWTWVLGRLCRCGAKGRVGAAGLLLGAGGCFVYFTESPCTLAERCLPVEPLEIGLNAERRAIVDTLIAHTNEDARILWEDRDGARHASRWPALLPLLTPRRYIGALDPDGFIEHSSICLNEQMLETQLIRPSKDEEWSDYCRRYNVRWIVAWSPTVIERLERWPAAKKIQALADGDTGWLFEIDRTPSYALRGQAELLCADGQQIMLRNVVPHNGEVVLSMHYQAGMRVSPSRVQIERATSGEDQIGFVRLRLAVPAAVVTLTWDR
jgi:hypothetical protein